MSGLETTKGEGERGKGKGEERKGEGRKAKGARRDLLERPFCLSLSTFPTAVQAVKLLPHPQPPVAFGLLNVKPDPCIELT